MKVVTKTEQFTKLARYFEDTKKLGTYRLLHKYGKQGVEALREYTPKDTGLTADSWTYSIIRENGKDIVQWDNTNIQNGIKIAVILQYGHGTGSGGYVEGIDYINPALSSVFDALANEAWKEVTDL